MTPAARQFVETLAKAAARAAFAESTRPAAAVTVANVRKAAGAIKTVLA